MSTGTKECPFCDETIRVKARKCRYCGEFVQGSSPAGAGGDRIDVGDMDDVTAAAIGRQSQAAHIEKMEGTFIQAQGDVTVGKELRDEQFYIAQNWDGKTLMRGFDLSGRDLSGLDFSNADLAQANLSGAYLIETLLDHASLVGADLRGATLEDCDFRNAYLSEANLNRTNLSHCNLDYADLTGAHLSGADLSHAWLRHTFLDGANLRSALIEGAVLSEAILWGANLTGADLSGAELYGADFEDAILTDAKLDGAVYSSTTKFPPHIDPARFDMYYDETYPGDPFTTDSDPDLDIDWDGWRSFF